MFFEFFYSLLYLVFIYFLYWLILFLVLRFNNYLLKVLQFDNLLLKLIKKNQTLTFLYNTLRFIFVNKIHLSESRLYEKESEQAAFLKLKQKATVVYVNFPLYVLYKKPCGILAWFENRNHDNILISAIVDRKIDATFGEEIPYEFYTYSSVTVLLNFFYRFSIFLYKPKHVKRLFITPTFFIDFYCIRSYKTRPLTFARKRHILTLTEEICLLLFWYGFLFLEFLIILFFTIKEILRKFLQIEINFFSRYYTLYLTGESAYIPAEILWM